MTLFERARRRLRAHCAPVLACARSLLWQPVESAALALSASGEGARPGATEPLLIARFRDYAPGSAEPSTEAIHLERPLEEAGITYESFHWESLDGVLFKGLAVWRVARAAPHRALVLSSYGPGRWDQPLPGALRAIRVRLGLPLVAIWWDSCTPSFAESMRPLVDIADLHVIVDNPCFDKSSPPHLAAAAERFLALWPPCEPACYRMELERDIAVSFSGQVSSYRSERASYVRKLREFPGAVVVASEERRAQPPYAEYVRLLNRSRMAVNFSYSVDRHQLKARVFETMLSGALLLESRNPQTAKYFAEGREYIAFDSPEDMLDKVHHFASHPAECARIASAGRRKAAEAYSGRAFWQRILERLP